MKYRKFHNIFWATLALAIIVDSSFDFMALKQSYVTDETGRMVEHTYEVLDQIASLGLALRDNMQSQLDHNVRAEKESALNFRDHLANLKVLVGDDEIQGERFQDFENISDKDLSVKSADISVALANARMREETVLKRRIDEDARQNSSGKMKMYVASILDLFLMLLAGTIWFTYDRTRRRDDVLLNEAISNSNRTNLELRELLERKSRELESTVHDLKSPLGSIQGITEILDEEKGNPDSVAEMSQILQQVSNRTLELVNSLVQAESKIAESHKPADFDLLLTLEDVVQSLVPQATTKHQTIKEIHEENRLPIYGDSKQVYHLLMNVVGNAIKFSPQSTEIHVRSRISQNEIVIEVADEGPGFTEADKHNAFGRRQKLSAKPTGGESSSGLGLNIAKEIAETHHGTIRIRDNASGKGACIVITLPLSKST